MTAQRRNRADRLIHPGATDAQIACDFAMAPFDRAMEEAEKTWGINRLPGYCTPELAAKFGKAMAHLNSARAAEDPALTAAAVANCVKGIAAMNAEARAAGHLPAPPDFWQYEFEGRVFAIYRDSGDWKKFADQFPGMPLYSMLEVANALAHYGNLVADAKAAFPGAQVVPFQTKSATISESLDDEIPF